MSPATSRLLGLLAFVPFSLTHATAQDAKGKDKEKDWDVSKLDVAKLPAAAKQENVTFEKDILPLFKASCLGCHGERKQKGDLRLDSLDATLQGGEHGKAVVPGEAAKSSILFAAAQVNNDIAMPPKRGGGGPGGPGGQNRPGRPERDEKKDPAEDKDAPKPPGGSPPERGGQRAKPLTNDQVALLRAWIEQGAK